MEVTSRDETNGMTLSLKCPDDMPSTDLVQMLRIMTQSLIGHVEHFCESK